MLTRFVTPFAQMYWIDYPFFQLLAIIYVVLFQLGFQLSVNPMKLKFANRIEVLNGSCALGVLYCFLSLSTGLLPEEALDANGLLIIAIIISIIFI